MPGSTVTRTLELASAAAERTTAATDALLALTVSGGLIQLRRATPASWRRTVWMAALATFAASALLGTVVHGIAFPPQVSDALWQPLYLLLGVAVALFATGALADWRGERAGRASLPALIALAGGFYFAARLSGGDFRVFLLFEAAALLFALCVYGRLARLERPGAGTMAVALAVSLAAGAVQAAEGLSIQVIWVFDHNGLFHLVQLAGVVLLVRGLMLSLQPVRT
ncbi:MAG TPA: hypothetical protein VE091_04260 [Gemmatimonadales bacterium]|nr:hypothetical protein [Gemmatimonadales bacterium]